MSRERWVQSVSRVDKPWGHEEIFALVEGSYCGKVIHISADHALSLQYHEHKDETIFVLSGTIRLEVGADAASLDVLQMTPGDAVHLAPGTVHRMTALSDAVILEGSTAGAGWREDVVRLDDQYGRAGTVAP